MIRIALVLSLIHIFTVLERCNNQYGKMWECPDFFPLDGKQVLMLGPMAVSYTHLDVYKRQRQRWRCGRS